MKPLWFCVLILIGIAFASALSFGGDWRSKFTDEAGRDCCGEHDCKIVNATSVQIGDRFVIDGKTVWVTIIHPSQDKHIWVCKFTGCAFVPGTS